MLMGGGTMTHSEATNKGGLYGKKYRYAISRSRFPSEGTQ